MQKHRVAGGFTQAEVAERANLSLKYVGEIERGEANTTIEVLERLATAVQWDPMESMEGLHEPISEGVRILLIALAEEIIERLHQAIRRLQALSPLYAKSSMMTAAQRHTVTASLPAVDHANQARPTLGQRLRRRLKP
jgi:transcriptional regulator with XRE-family HTH domain